jgi:hypothetical protein
MFCLVFCFCEYVEDPGLCSNPPRSSKNELLFGTQGGIDSVTANHPYWWLAVPVEDSSECEFWGRGSDPDYCNNNYCRSNGIMKAQCPWFSVTRTDGHTLVVSISQNETGEERKQFVVMSGGNCGAGFSIIQSAE